MSTAPLLKPNPALHVLINTCEEYMNFLESKDYHEDHDYAHYIFEAALEALYGPEVWAFVNSK